MIVLDTNVVSEVMRAEPNSDVVAWLDGLPRGEIWTTTITVGEIAAGIALLPAGIRRTQLADAFHLALDGFDDRILPFTTATALGYGAVIAARTAAGSPISIADAQIAAIVVGSDGTLATRNLSDFVGTGVDLVNPWDARAQG
ncbi:type II toxin-antitoxin system VapC family toxin [Microbacterium sp.]|uniref:type II toxin-antitoxin system VapC family toxin n=1 Tax=Microbacterium sp. TaxID=51671 RepID=UPI003A90CAC3